MRQSHLQGTSLELQLSPGGIKRWFEAVYEPYRDDGGRIKGVISHSRDITDRKQAERELQESRAQLETALSSMTDAVCISDAQGRFIDFNDAIPQFNNAPLEVFIFRAVQELLFNLVKHAGVKSGRVDLSGASGALEISVSDQGEGFDLSMLDPSTGHIGIRVLHAAIRQARLGGHCPGHGPPFEFSQPNCPNAIKRQNETEPIASFRREPFSSFFDKLRVSLI